MLEKHMEGRLGNQFFQYAAMRGFQEIFNDPDLNLIFHPYSGVNNPQGFTNDLIYFNVKPFHSLSETSPSFFQKIVFTLANKYLLAYDSRETQRKKEERVQPFLNLFGIYWITQGYYPFKKSRVKNKQFIGYFESEKFFNHIRNELLQELTPINPAPDKNRTLYEAAIEKQSVCVSIRRGDFSDNDNVRKDAFLCDNLYFEKAMKKMKELLPNAVWVVFSDDINWVKSNMTFDGEAFFEDGSDPVWEKLRLMYSCKHFIISNSSFSWWTQYLSRNENKVVIAPSKWRTYAGRWTDIYQKNWILIDV